MKSGSVVVLIGEIISIAVLAVTKKVYNKIKIQFNYSLQKKTCMADRCITKCSTWPVVRELQIKTIMRYFIPIRLAKSKISDSSNCWWECGAESNVIGSWWGCKLVQSIWRTKGFYIKVKRICTTTQHCLCLLCTWDKLVQGEVCENVYCSIFQKSERLIPPKYPSTRE